MANAPLELERVTRAPEPVEDVPSLDQLRWMLQTEGVAMPAGDKASLGSPVGPAGRLLGWAVSPTRVCGGLALLAVAAAVLAMLHATDPAASARAVSAPAVAGLPATPMPPPPTPTPIPKMAAEANPSAAPLTPEPANFAVPRQAAAASPSTGSPSTASPRAEGAMTLAPWAVRPAMSILAPNPAGVQASRVSKATPGATAEIARPPEVMPDMATPPAPPARARQKAAESAPKVRRSGVRVAFHRLRSHAHHLWRAASWQYPPYPSGTGYYFVRGSARGD